MMSFLGSVGRVIGRGVENVGRILHSETLQNVGRGIQDACSETARKTGNTREYDSETASFEETQSMATILANFHDTLKPQTSNLEKECREAIDNYFSDLIISLSKALDNDRVIKKLSNRKRTVTRSIGNTFGNVLSKRVSLSDSECKKILEMPRGQGKESAMSSFGKKVIIEGRSLLCKNIAESIAELNEEISEEIDGVLERQTIGVKDVVRQLEELLIHRTSNVQDTETALLTCAKKLSAVELSLNVLEAK